MLKCMAIINSRWEKFWYYLFEFGIFIKGFNGLWETITGSLILFVTKETFIRWFYFWTWDELLEDPNDNLIHFFSRVLTNVSGDTKTFVGIYIFLHGIINLFLAIQLFRKKLWAYIAAMSIMLLFMSYQIYRIMLHHSIVLTLITLFDIGFVILTAHEYKIQKLKHASLSQNL